MDAMDCISLRQIELYGYHGVFAEENRLGQRFVLDVELLLNLREAGQTDSLEATVNYAEVLERIRGVVQGPPMKLIETVAESVATELLETYTKIRVVQVKVTKPNPPVAIPFGGVSVTIIRQRGEGGQS